MTSKDRAGVPRPPGARDGLRPTREASAALLHARERARQGTLPLQGTALAWQLGTVHGPSLDVPALIARHLDQACSFEVTPTALPAPGSVLIWPGRPVWLEVPGESWPDQPWAFTGALCFGTVMGQVLAAHVLLIGPVIHPALFALKPGTPLPVLPETDPHALILRALAALD